MRIILLFLALTLNAGAAIVNWTNIPNQYPYASGDTVKLWGTFTNGFTITNSGTVGNPLTFQFQTGCVFTKTNWSPAPGAAIYASGKSYITIDGNNAGVITCTSNGTSLAHQVDCSAIRFDGAVDNIIVKNLLISNIYVRVYGTANDQYGYGVNVSSGGHDITVSNLTSVQAANHINLAYGSGCSNYYVLNSRVVGYSAAVQIGSTGSGATVTNVVIDGVEASDASNWGGQGAIHSDAFHLYAVATSSRLDGLIVRNCYVHGDPGDHSTAYLYIEGYVEAPWIYNNVFSLEQNTAGPATGLVNLKGGNNARFFNNTIVGAYYSSPPLEGHYTGLYTQGWTDLETNIVVTNNIFADCNYSVYESTATTMFGTFDYNIYSRGSAMRVASTAYSWSTWTAAGKDPNGTNSTVVFDSVYAPTNGVATARGKNLSGYFTTDRNGSARPASAAWTVGAVELTAVTPTIITNNASGVRLRGWRGL